MTALWTVLLLLLVMKDNYLSAVRAAGSNRGLPTDAQISIIPPPSTYLMGWCPVRSSPRNVRLQSIRTDSGLIFSRKAVTQDVFDCFEALGSQELLAATNIGECSRQTEAAGLQMFRWDGGSCTGYTNGIPGKCVGTGSVVLYSAQVAAAGQATISNFDSTPTEPNSAIITWDANVIGGSSCTVKYQITFGDLVKDETAPTTTLLLDGLSPCAEVPATVTVFNADNVAIGSGVYMVDGPYTEEPTLVDMSFSNNLDLVYFNWTMDDPCESIDHYTIQPPSEPFQVEEYSMEGAEICDGDPSVTFFVTTKNGTTTSFWTTYYKLSWYIDERIGMPDFQLFHWESKSSCGFRTSSDSMDTSFADAQQICAELSGQLYGGPYDAELFTFLSVTPRLYWVDLKKESGTWTWGGSNSELQGDHWGSPPGAGQDCATAEVKSTASTDPREKLVAKGCSETAGVLCFKQY